MCVCRLLSLPLNETLTPSETFPRYWIWPFLSLSQRPPKIIKTQSPQQQNHPTLRPSQIRGFFLNPLGPLSGTFRKKRAFYKLNLNVPFLQTNKLWVGNCLSGVSRSIKLRWFSLKWPGIPQDNGVCFSSRILQLKQRITLQCNHAILVVR